MLRVGMLTSGGDCQALNAAMRVWQKVFTNSAARSKFMALKTDTEDWYANSII